MDSFWGDVSKPGWWIGVVVVGLLLNVFANYFLAVPTSLTHTTSLQLL